MKQDSAMPNTGARQPSTMAIASLCCGILYPGFICVLIALDHPDCPPLWVDNVSRAIGVASVLLPFIAVILGHLGRRNIRRSQGSLSGWGLAGAGFKLGYLWFACWIIVALAMPNFLHSKIAAHEASAVGSLRTLSNAIHAYANGHPGQGFPSTLAELSQDIPVNAGKPWAIDPRLANAERYCYHFSYSPHSKRLDGRLDAFEIIADPIHPGTRKSGIRYFSVDETRTIAFGKTRDTINNTL